MYLCRKMEGETPSQIPTLIYVTLSVTAFLRVSYLGKWINGLNVRAKTIQTLKRKHRGKSP